MRLNSAQRVFVVVVVIVILFLFFFFLQPKQHRGAAGAPKRAK